MCTLTKGMKLKVKRRRVDWYQALEDNYTQELSEEFWLLAGRFIKKTGTFSFNRVAYNVLKRHYSTTAMLRYRYTGSFL